MFVLTGGSGFIGQSLIRHNNKDQVVTIGRTPAASHHIVRDLHTKRPDDISKIANALLPYQPHVLVHCAAVTPWSSPLPDYSPDLLMAKSVVELCELLHIKRILFISGWNVYHTAATIPYSESNTPLHPVTDYGKSKLAVEQYFKQNLQNTSLVNLRLASVYGPGQSVAGLIPNLVTSALAGKDLQLQAVKTKRDYIYIDDVAEAITSSMTMNLAEVVTDINIGSGRSISVANVASCVRDICYKLYGQPAKIVTAGQLSEAYPPDNQLLIDKARSHGLLHDLTPFETGIQQYMQWRKHETIL